MIEATITTKQEGVLTLKPVDSEGQPVRLDADAIRVDPTEGLGGITTTVTQLENGDFEVIFRSGDSPTAGHVPFVVKGDAEPGEGETIIEEIVRIRVTPVSAVSLGPVFTTRAKV